MSWYKTYRKGQTTGGSASASFSYAGSSSSTSRKPDSRAYGTAKSFKSLPPSHTYSPNPGKREHVIMGYEDTVRAARKLNVDSDPIFMTSISEKIFMTDYTETIRVYNSIGKRLPSIHAESNQSMLSGLATNQKQNKLFVCDAHAQNARVQIFNVSSRGDDLTPQVFLGHGLFKAPHGITVTPDDRTLVTDVERKEIFIIQENGSNALCFGGSGQRPGLFAYPHAVAYDAEHKRIVVSDTHNHRIQVFDDNGHFLKLVHLDQKDRPIFNFPTGIVFDPNNNLLVCDTEFLHVFTPDMQPFRKVKMTKMNLVKPTAVINLDFGRLCIASRDEQSIVLF